MEIPLDLGARFQYEESMETAKTPSLSIESITVGTKIKATANDGLIWTVSKLSLVRNPILGNLDTVITLNAENAEEAKLGLAEMEIGRAHV